MELGLVSGFGADVDNLLQDYRSSVIKANSRHNLVARHDVDKRLTNLILESLAPLQREGCRIEAPLLDIGSGGGMPGIPLMIAKPQLSGVLLDAERQKTLFLRSTVASLGLKRVEVVHQRVEDFAELAANAGRFSTVTARGVGKASLVMNCAAKLLRPSGELVLWMSPGLWQDVEAGPAWSAPVVLDVAPGLQIVRWDRLSAV